MRTVLSEQQLQTLRTVYASNPRPDALLKEHLVEITGLNPRVIRVWFQNKRCKDKKRVLAAEAARLQSLQQQQQQGASKVCTHATEVNSKHRSHTITTFLVVVRPYILIYSCKVSLECASHLVFLPIHR